MAGIDVVGMGVDCIDAAGIAVAGIAVDGLGLSVKAGPGMIGMVTMACLAWAWPALTWKAWVWLTRA
jgi:hypothetical protein